MGFERQLVAALLTFGLAAANASNFGVTPLRVDLGAKAKSGSVTVTNHDKATLSFQVYVRKWTQAASGDVYEETKDLIVFPQQLEIGPGQKKLVRVGFEGSPPKREAAYRLFIEELPPATSPASGHSGEVKVLGRFGLPVLLRDANAKPHFLIDALDVKGGTVTAKVSNIGDAGSRVLRLSVAPSTESLPGFAGDWLLAGSSREFTGKLEGAACKPGSKVTFEVDGVTGVKATKEVTLSPDACKG